MSDPRLRRFVLAACVSAIALGPGVVAEAARAQQSARPEARVVAPARDAVVTGTTVRTVVRLPAGAADVRVTLNRRRITRRLARAGGRLHGRLQPRDGLRRGTNTLLVVARRDRERLVAARVFAVVRRRPSLATMSVRRRAGAVAVRVVVGRGRARGNALTRALAGQSRELRLRSWLNGRPVSARFSAPRRTAWRASLSAADGLRHGRNMLRVRVIEPTRGRYVDLTRHVTAPRSRPLASAGRDRVVPHGVATSLDGRASRSTRPNGRLRYRWKLVSRPAGSKARLRGRRQPRPTLVPDRPGRYRARMVLSERTRSGPGASTDQVAVTATPAAPLHSLVTIRGSAADGYGIAVDDQLYRNPSASGTGMQVLTLDRLTLRPTGKGNWSIDGSGSADTGVPALANYLADLGTASLVIISRPPGASAPVSSSQVKRFTQALALMGVPQPPAAALTATGATLSIIGVPYAGPGTGWWAPRQHGGWISPDPSGKFAFTPLQFAFDTSVQSTPTSNTMSIRFEGSAEYRPTATLAPGYDGGFQVAVLNGYDLTPIVDAKTYSTNYAGQTAAPQVSQLAADLRAAAANPNALVLVQSIGTVSPDPPDLPGNPVWGDLARALQALGGNAHLVNTLDGSYALVGGTALGFEEAGEDSSTIPPASQDAVPHLGRLNGYLAADHGGFYAPLVSDPTGLMNLGLYELLYQAPKPWPYTEAAGDPDAAAYERALAYIAEQLELTNYVSDLRVAYYDLDTADWDATSKLLDLVPFQPGLGFTEDQLTTLKKQLTTEFAAISRTKAMFEGYGTPFSRAGVKPLIDLETIGSDIKDSVEAGENSFVSEYIAILTEVVGVAGEFGGDEVAKAIGVFQAAVSIGSDLANDANHNPLSQQIDARVRDLSSQVADRLSAASGTMDALHDIVVSDYGKLTEMDGHWGDTTWLANSNAIGNAKDLLEAASKRWFYAQLLPIGYRAYALDRPAGQCGVLHSTGGFQTVAYPWSTEPATGQVTLTTGFAGNPLAPQQSVLAWATKDPSLSAVTPPSSTVTDPLFTRTDQTTPDHQSGLGLYAPWFFVRNFKPQTVFCQK